MLRRKRRKDNQSILKSEKKGRNDHGHQPVSLRTPRRKRGADPMIVSVFDRERRSQGTVPPNVREERKRKNKPLTCPHSNPPRGRGDGSVQPREANIGEWR